MQVARTFILPGSGSLTTPHAPPAGRSATGSWGRDEQGRLRRFSARTTRILNSILASSGSAGTAGAAANGHDGGSADTE